MYSLLLKKRFLNTVSFALTEALLALTILSSGIAFIMGSYAATYRIAQTSSNYTQAIIKMENVISMLLYHGSVDAFFSPDGDEPQDPDQKFNIKIEESPFVFPNTKDLQASRIIVEWPAPSPKKSLRTTLVLFAASQTYEEENTQDTVILKTIIANPSALRDPSP